MTKPYKQKSVYKTKKHEKYIVKFINKNEKKNKNKNGRRNTRRYSIYNSNNVRWKEINNNKSSQIYPSTTAINMYTFYYTHEMMKTGTELK